MSAVGVTFGRTLSRARNVYSTAFVTAAFIAVAAVRFAFGLEASEGARLVVAEAWSNSVAPLLPVLAALYSMDLLSEERRSGRMEMLLSVAVRERDLLIGKFFGAWFMLLSATALSLVGVAVSLVAFAPESLAWVHVADFMPSLLILTAQGALWCAVSLMMSAMFERGAVAACASVALTVALPRGVWTALRLWSGEGGASFGEMPFDAHVADFASGAISTGVLVFYAAFACAALFAASKSILMLRFGGKGGRKGRWACVVAIALAVTCAVSTSMLAFRLDASLDIPVGDEVEFSPQMRHVLSEASGTVTATCFLSRSAGEFRRVAQFLRMLKRQADSAGGLKISLRFVDPRWNIGAAGRLVKMGVPENSVVFEKGGRFAVLTQEEGFGDHFAASAIRRIAMPPQHRDVYWTTGHGEASFSAYGNWGMSDIARELAREGYRNLALDLTGDKSIPPDCALIIVAGAKNDFSRTELGRIDAYLRAGGRLLVMIGQPGEGGVASLLPSWGMRTVALPISGAKTLSGTDAIVSDFADHEITASLVGSRIVLEKPLVFTKSAAAESGAGADRIEFTPVAMAGQSAVVAAVERGGGAGRDLALRPTRLVAVGDPNFAVNGQLAERANANRDFFMNIVAYLSGSDQTGADGRDQSAFSTGMDREGKVRFLVFSAAVFPLAVLFSMLFVAARRRHRK